MYTKEEAQQLIAEGLKKEYTPVKNDTNVISFSLMVTGTDSSEDEIIEIAVVDGNENVLINTLVRPYWKESWRDADILSDITPQMVAKAPQAHEIVAQVKAIFDNAHVWITYYGDFFLEFLARWGIEPTGHYLAFMTDTPIPIIKQRWNEKIYAYHRKEAAGTLECYGKDYEYDSLHDAQSSLLQYILDKTYIDEYRQICEEAEARPVGEYADDDIVCQDYDPREKDVDEELANVEPQWEPDDYDWEEEWFERLNN